MKKWLVRLSLIVLVPLAFVFRAFANIPDLAEATVNVWKHGEF